MVVANVTLRKSATIVLQVVHDEVLLLYAKFEVHPGSVWAMCGRALWDMSHGVVPKDIPRAKHDHHCKECRVSLPPPPPPPYGWFLLCWVARMPRHDYPAPRDTRSLRSP